MWGSVLGCGGGVGKCRGRCRKVSGEVWGVWESVLGCGGDVGKCWGGVGAV